MLYFFFKHILYHVIVHTSYIHLMMLFNIWIFASISNVIYTWPICFSPAWSADSVSGQLRSGHSSFEMDRYSAKRYSYFRYIITLYRFYSNGYSLVSCRIFITFLWIQNIWYWVNEIFHWQYYNIFMNAWFAGYVINYKRDHGDWEELHIESKSESHVLRNLWCGTRYQLYITAYNKIGTGLPCDIVNAYTKGTGKRYRLSRTDT